MEHTHPRREGVRTAGVQPPPGLRLKRHAAVDAERVGDPRAAGRAAAAVGGRGPLVVHAVALTARIQRDDLGGHHAQLCAWVRRQPLALVRPRLAISGERRADAARRVLVVVGAVRVRRRGRDVNVRISVLWIG